LIGIGFVIKRKSKKRDIDIQMQFQTGRALGLNPFIAKSMGIIALGSKWPLNANHHILLPLFY